MQVQVPYGTVPYGTVQVLRIDILLIIIIVQDRTGTVKGQITFIK